MKELSVFVDESGNYGGENAKHYLVTLVFHRQSISNTKKPNSNALLLIFTKRDNPSAQLFFSNYDPS